MLTAKRLGATLFSFCSLLIATAAHADDTPPEDTAPITTTTTATKVATDTTMSGAFVFLSSYAMGIAVSLSADQACQGPTCKERYLSFVPVVGGVLQFMTAGKDFHDQHHSDNCYPLTIADVTGQALGVVGITTGLLMRYFAHKHAAAHESAVEVTGTVDHGASVGLSVHFK